MDFDGGVGDLPFSQVFAGCAEQASGASSKRVERGARKFAAVQGRVLLAVEIIVFTGAIMRPPQRIFLDEGV